MGSMLSAHLSSRFITIRCNFVCSSTRNIDTFFFLFIFSANFFFSRVDPKSKQQITTSSFFFWFTGKTSFFLNDCRFWWNIFFFFFFFLIINWEIAGNFERKNSRHVYRSRLMKGLVHFSACSTRWKMFLLSRLRGLYFMPLSLGTNS